MENPVVTRPAVTKPEEIDLKGKDSAYSAALLALQDQIYKPDASPVTRALAQEIIAASLSKSLNREVVPVSLLLARIIRSAKASKDFPIEEVDHRYVPLRVHASFSHAVAKAKEAPVPLVNPSVSLPKITIAGNKVTIEGKLDVEAEGPSGKLRLGFEKLIITILSMFP